MKRAKARTIILVNGKVDIDTNPMTKKEWVDRLQELYKQYETCKYINGDCIMFINRKKEL